ncbi:MAG: HNH endonuclease family protein, partial [Ghiorsea sp.]
LYEWIGNGDLTYFFWKYENHLRTTQQPKSSPMSESEFVSKSSKFKLTIEHIACQTPKQTIVTDENIIPEISEEFKEEYLHSIGNLTIDPKSSNSSKGNKLFQDKNEKYFRKAPFKTQNELENFIFNGQWSDKSIRKRKKALIKFALNEWSIDES